MRCIAIKDRVGVGITANPSTIRRCFCAIKRSRFSSRNTAYIITVVDGGRGSI